MQPMPTSNKPMQRFPKPHACNPQRLHIHVSHARSCSVRRYSHAAHAKLLSPHAAHAHLASGFDWPTKLAHPHRPRTCCLACSCSLATSPARMARQQAFKTSDFGPSWRRWRGALKWATVKAFLSVVLQRSPASAIQLWHQCLKAGHLWAC